MQTQLFPPCCTELPPGRVTLILCWYFKGKKPLKHESMWQKRGESEWCHALSAKRVTQCKAWWPTFPFHSLCTVALAPRVTSTPVRFNRVYSKVTPGTRSFVYLFFISWMHELNHTVKGAVCPCVHVTHISSLYHPDLLLRLHPTALIEMTAFDYLSVNGGRLFIYAIYPHQQHILYCSVL